MRTVSFSNQNVSQALNSNFVCTHTSIAGTPTAGHSLKHTPQEPPGLCGRGAGRQNVQIVFMTPEHKMYHVVTGYLDPKDLLDEARFASHMYRELNRNPKQTGKAVVTLHAQRLQELGFSREEITAPENMMSEMLATSFSPEDLGMNLGGMTPLGGAQNGNMLQQMNRQRVLKDHRFVMKNPLLDRVAFEAAPQDLVGRHSSFFGSSGGPQTHMIQNMNRMMQRR